MDSTRQLEIFRGFAKSVLRKKGLHFEGNFTHRDIGREVKEFNELNKLSTPLTVEEFSGLYIQIMQELIVEHFTHLKVVSAGKKSGIPGLAFRNTAVEHGPR